MSEKERDLDTEIPQLLERAVSAIEKILVYDMKQRETEHVRKNWLDIHHHMI